MSELKTEFGTVEILGREALFQRKTELIEAAAATEAGMAAIGLTGGSSPKAYYLWAVENLPFSPRVKENVVWMVSDERDVPLTSGDSNFGTADRMMLGPLKMPDEQKSPWPAGLQPDEAAEVFCDRWSNKFGNERCFDLCVLGMGDDCHTASMFPKGPLLSSSTTDLFAAVDVSGKGARLTITPAGLRACGRILVMVMGEGKAAALQRVFHGRYEPFNKPIQQLKDHADRVTWLIDPPAAARLELE